MSQLVATYPLGGGLDLVTQAVAVPAGRLVDALNYEPLAEGYGRLAGYERFNGRPLPSQTTFSGLRFTRASSAPAIGESVTGFNSRATGVLLAAPSVTAGDFAEGDAEGTLALVRVSGTFEAGEHLYARGGRIATAAGPASAESAPDEKTRGEWTRLVQEEHRKRILPVPGVGPVRGVAVFRGTVYAWRDQDATYAAMFRATADGWAEVQASYVVPFGTGTTEVEEGATVASGDATATVVRVVRQDGSYSAGDASGYLVLRARSAPFVAGPLKVGTATVVQATAADQRVRFKPGGRYDTIGHNFYGAADRFRLYGAYGEGPGFEFDGTAVAPISTGMVDDRPTRVAELAHHLLFTFRGGSVQFSAPGEPLVWDPVVGAGELGLGDEVTDVLQSTETAVVLFGRGRIAVLTGRDAASFTLEELSEEAGAEAFTAQRVGSAVYLDRRGLRTLSATSAFGNFKTGTLTELIAPYLAAKRATGALPAVSLVCKTKSQYRLFWNDRSGITVYMGRKQPEIIPFELPIQLTCAAVGEMDDGTEGMFAGADDGFVYRLDSGPSFDGAAVRGFALLPYTHLGSLMQNKRFHAVSMELIAAPDTRLGLSCQFDYSDGTQPMDGGREFLVGGGGGIWNSSLWDEFYWSAAYEGTATAPIDGFGRNISVLVGALSDPLEGPHVLQAYHIHYSPRGLRRIG